MPGRICVNAITGIIETPGDADQKMWRCTSERWMGMASDKTSAPDRELHIYTWRDYTSPALISKFEENHSVKVTLSDYDSNETMLANINAGGARYDIVVPSDYIVQVLADAGLLAKTNPCSMLNFKYVKRQFVDVFWDRGRQYSVPWLWGTTAFAVDTAVYAGNIDTLKLLFEPSRELQGRINIQPDVGEVVNAALRYLRLPRCNTNPKDLRTVRDLLLGAKRYWQSIDYPMIEPMVSGRIALSHGWNGAALRIRQQRPTVRYAYPREGLNGWTENVVVLKEAANLETAKLFQNFVMAPENAALISEYSCYANAIAGSEAFLPANFAAAPEIRIPDDSPRPEFLPLCPPGVQERYLEIWSELLRA
jgi:spermidine/putrescine transport system substrate-binding protein